MPLGNVIVRCDVNGITAAEGDFLGRLEAATGTFKKEIWRRQEAHFQGNWKQHLAHSKGHYKPQQVHLGE